MKYLSSVQIFTSTKVANEMLDLLDQKVFSESETFFFEPSCGDGGILIPILERIYMELLKKYDGMKSKALAETLHKFYAIELDENLIRKCRERVFLFFKEKANDVGSCEELIDLLIANQIADAIEHNDFFEVMKDGEICRKSKRKSLQKLRDNIPKRDISDKHLP